MKSIYINKLLSLLTVGILAASFPTDVLYGQEAPAGGGTAGEVSLSKEYFKQHPIVYIRNQNDVLFGGKRVLAGLVVKNVIDVNRVLNYSSFLGLGLPLPGYSFGGLIDSLPGAAVSVKVKTAAGDLTFSENLQKLSEAGSIYVGATAANGKKYKLQIGVIMPYEPILIKINPSDWLPTSVPYYYVDFGNEVIEITEESKPTPKAGWAVKDFEQHPIIYARGTLKGNTTVTEVSFKGKPVTAMISVGPLYQKIKCEDIPYGDMSGTPWGYGCLGLLDNEKNAIVTIEVATEVGSLVFSKSISELSGVGTNEWLPLKATVGGKEYRLSAKATKTTVGVKLGTETTIRGYNLGSSVPCYRVNCGDKIVVIEETTGGETDSGKKIQADELGTQVMTKGYVLADPQIGLGGPGYNFEGKMITVALSPMAANKPVTNPESALEVESRITGQYEDYKALGFPQGRELVVMVDGEIKGRRVNFDTRRAPFDLIINGKQMKFFIYITPAKVDFDIMPVFGGYWSTHYRPVDMYIITIGR